MARVALTALGCKVNQFETEIIAGLFKERGYEITDFTAPADIYIINTCSVTHLGEKKSRQLIRRAKRTNREAVIAALGCYAQVSPQEVAAIKEVDVVIGTKDKGKIVDLIEASIEKRVKITAVGDYLDIKEFEDIPQIYPPERARAFLKIQEGCENFCTYCIIPYARGPLRSRKLTSIILEAEKLIRAGFGEIVLTGIHLGAYGKESGKNPALAGVIKALLALDGLNRLRLSSLESIEVTDEILDIMSGDDRLCPHLHLPLQSGDDDILKAMNRRYTANEFRALVENIQKKVKDIAVTTDVITGFPGESENMFNNTAAFIETVDFAGIHVFPYSKRRGTAAAGFSGEVATEEKKRRAGILQKLSLKKTADFNKRFIDKDLSVLWETEKEGAIDGLSGNYIRVYAKNGAAKPGSLTTVKIARLYKDGVWAEV